jgi:hypothetical protein
MYMDKYAKRFGAWRLDDTAQSSAVRFSLFFPDRGKDPSQYATLPKDANGKDIEVKDYGNPQRLCLPATIYISISSHSMMERRAVWAIRVLATVAQTIRIPHL